MPRYCNGRSLFLPFSVQLKVPLTNLWCLSRWSRKGQALLRPRISRLLSVFQPTVGTNARPLRAWPRDSSVPSLNVLEENKGFLISLALTARFRQRRSIAVIMARTQMKILKKRCLPQERRKVNTKIRRGELTNWFHTRCTEVCIQFWTCQTRYQLVSVIAQRSLCFSYQTTNSILVQLINEARAHTIYINK